MEQQIRAALIERYDAKIRGGYPTGEALEDLRADGFTAAEAEAVLQEIFARKEARAVQRDRYIPYIVGVSLLGIGAVGLATGAQLGWYSIAGGIIKLVYSVFIQKPGKG